MPPRPRPVSVYSRIQITTTCCSYLTNDRTKRYLLPELNNNSILEPFHARLRSLRISRSQARDELFLLLLAHGPCTRVQLAKLANASRRPIYTNISLFLKAEIAVEIKPGQFELSDRFNQHYHYMWCRICGKGTKFNVEGIEKALMRAFDGGGFAMEDHEMSIKGICGMCRQDPKNRPQPAIGTRFRRYILQT